MARVKGALNAKKRHKKVLKLARGYNGARSKQYRVAKHKNQRCCKKVRHFLQPAYAWS